MVTKNSRLILVFKALGDPTREAIVERLARGPQPVHRLASGFAVSRPAISRHLRLLKEAGIIGERRSGRERLYFLRPEELTSVAEWAMAIERAGGMATGEARAGESRIGGGEAGEPGAGGIGAGTIPGGDAESSRPGAGGGEAERSAKAGGRRRGPATRRKKTLQSRHRRTGVVAKPVVRPEEAGEASNAAPGPTESDWKSW